MTKLQGRNNNPYYPASLPTPKSKLKQRAAEASAILVGASIALASVYGCDKYFLHIIPPKTEASTGELIEHGINQVNDWVDEKTNPVHKLHSKDV